LGTHDRQVFGDLFKKLEEHGIFGHENLQKGIESGHCICFSPVKQVVNCENTVCRVGVGTSRRINVNLIQANNSLF
jgi:hypothetical protein